MVVSHSLKVNVVHGILGGHTLSVVVSQHLAQKVKSLVTHQLVVLRVNELGPGLARDRLLRQNVFVVGIERQSVLIEVGIELLSSKNLGNLHELVVVVTSLEEGLALEDHTCKHAAKRPDVERVVISLEVNEELGSLEVAGGDANIVLLSGVVELSKTPIDETELAVGVIDHDVVGLHITVHDAFGVAVVESLQDLVHVKANVEVVEALVEFAEISIASVNKFSDNGWGLGQRVTDNVNELNNVNTMLESLQDLDLTSDLVLLDYAK